MDSIPPINPPPSPSTHTGLKLVGGLQVGQTLKASVVQGTPTGLTGGTATLRIGTEEIAVRARMSLQTGSSLNIRVDRLAPSILLAVLADKRAGPAKGDDLTPFLKTLLPRQGGLPTLFSALQGVSRTPGGALPAPLTRQLQGVLNQLSTPQEASRPQGLRHALRNSGLFLEANLARQVEGGAPANRSAAVVEPDFKAALHRLLHSLGHATAQPPAATAPGTRGALDALLAQALQSLPRPPGGTTPASQARLDPLPLKGLTMESLLGALRQFTEAASARVQLHQLASLESHQQGESRWYNELALRNGEFVDVLPLVIEREPGKDSDNEPEQAQWSATLALDLPGLGPLRAQVRVRGRYVQTLFEAHAQATVERISGELHRLREALQRRDLHVQTLSCSRGDSTPVPPASSGDSLVDTQA